MNEHEIDLSKLSYYEISMLIIERNTFNYKAEQITELLNKIGESKELINNTQPNEKDQQQLSGSKGLDELPWKSYKTKQAAGPDEAAWIFSNTKGAEALLATLKSKDGKVTIESFEYQLQGNARQFIARNTIK